MEALLDPFSGGPMANVSEQGPNQGWPPAVGQPSPDGDFIWDGQTWVANPQYVQSDSRPGPQDPVQVHLMRQTRALESINSRVGCLLWFIVGVFLLSVIGSLIFWVALSDALKSSY